jgi:hypothetical protein
LGLHCRRQSAVIQAGFEVGVQIIGHFSRSTCLIRTVLIDASISPAAADMIDSRKGRAVRRR